MFDSPSSSRVSVLLPLARSARSGYSRPLLAVSGCVQWISQRHAGGVPKRQHCFGAIQSMPVHPAGLVVLPGNQQNETTNRFHSFLYAF